MKKVTDTIRRNFKPVLGLALFLSAIFVLSFVPGNGLTEGAVATAIRPSVDSTAATVDTAAIRDDSTAIPGFRGRVGIVDVRRLPVLPPQELKKIDNETLWLARCIYSETKRPEEQELVAWVVRNRVEIAATIRTRRPCSIRISSVPSSRVRKPANITAA